MSVSIPGYVQAALLKFQREATKKPQDTLHPWNQPTHGANTQYAKTDTVDLVDAQSTLYVQRVCGTFPYYVIAVYQTMLVALSLELEEGCLDLSRNGDAHISVDVVPLEF